MTSPSGIIFVNIKFHTNKFWRLVVSHFQHFNRHIGLHQNHCQYAFNIRAWLFKIVDAVIHRTKVSNSLSNGQLFSGYNEVFKSIDSEWLAFDVFPHWRTSRIPCTYCLYAMVTETTRTFATCNFINNKITVMAELAEHILNAVNTTKCQI